MAVSSVVEPGGPPRREPLPGEREGREGLGDVAGAPELEGGSQGVPQRQPHDASHHPVGEIHGHGRQRSLVPAAFTRYPVGYTNL